VYEIVKYFFLADVLLLGRPLIPHSGTYGNSPASH
jgi:hypothetical protein